MNMKRIIAGVVIALMVAVVPVTLVGCKKSIYGTYKFNTVEVVVADGATEEEKLAAEMLKNSDELKSFADFQITVNKDGTYAVTAGGEVENTGKWKKKSGNEYIIYQEDENSGEVITIRDGKMIQTFETDYDNITIKIIYKK